MLKKRVIQKEKCMYERRWWEGGEKKTGMRKSMKTVGGRAMVCWWLRSRAEEIDGEVYGQSDGEICSKGKGKSEQEDRRGDRR